MLKAVKDILTSKINICFLRTLKLKFCIRGNLILCTSAHTAVGSEIIHKLCTRKNIHIIFLSKHEEFNIYFQIIVKLLFQTI